MTFRERRTLPRLAGLPLLCEVADEGERQEVETAADVEMVWLVRGGGPPAGRPVVGRDRAAR